MLKNELKKAYLDTTYSVFIDKNKYPVNIEKPLPFVINSLINEEQSAAIITAWNPKSKLLSVEENIKRNTKLNAKLKNYTVFKAEGQGEDLSWLAEESFFILGINKKEANILAIEYEQYAYVWLEKKGLASLIFTDI